jgi:archaemetzincin
MKRKCFIHFLILFLLLFSCKNQYIEKNSIAGKKEKNEKRATIIIQPLGDFPQSQTTIVSKELEKIYSGTVVVNNPIPIPKNALNYNKSRYRADSLISYLSRHTTKGYLTIGLTNKDISATKGKNKDWGLFGLGFCPGNSCIASSSRLKGENRIEKLFKVSIHELGHTQRLKHCPEKTCLMRDAEGMDHLNELKDFCPKCKSVLVKVGWQFKVMQ